MNNIGDLEISLLGFLLENPRHGYDLHRKVADMQGFGIVWRLKISNLYSLLNKLHEAGLISAENTQSGNRPVRTEYSITLDGRSVFEKWLTTPVRHGRDFRKYFLLKFYFVLQSGDDKIRKLINEQEVECKGWIKRFKQQQNSEKQNLMAFTKYVGQYRLNHIQTDLDWLNWVEETLNEEK